MFGYINVQCLSVRVDRAAAHVGNHVQLISRGLHPLGCHRKLFDLPYRTHCDLLPYICDDCPPNEQLYFRVISLCKSLANTDNNLSRICYAHAVSGSGSSVSNTISVISSRWAVPRKDICNITRSQPSIHNNNPDNEIRASIIRDLLLMKYMNRTDISSPVLDIDDINYMLTTLCTELFMYIIIIICIYVTFCFLLLHLIIYLCI